jgi:vacuolar iron transporter family protein
MAHTVTSAAAAASSVSLNRHAREDTGTRPPVWAIDAVEGTQEAPLQAKCSRHGDERRGVCCKELKPDDERQLIDPDVVRDAVIGLSVSMPQLMQSTPALTSARFQDGLTVPFALTAGLSSLGSSRVVVLGGLAELIAGAISMGIGGFLASQAERDHYRYLRRTTRARVLRSCAGEMEREVHAVLGPLGLEESLSRRVADALLKVEEDSEGAGDAASSSSNTDEAGLRWSKDVGISAFLLKFGEGLEEVPDRRM